MCMNHKFHLISRCLAQRSDIERSHSPLIVSWCIAIVVVTELKMHFSICIGFRCIRHQIDKVRTVISRINELYIEVVSTNPYIANADFIVTDTILCGWGNIKKFPSSTPRTHHLLSLYTYMYCFEARQQEYCNSQQCVVRL